MPKYILRVAYPEGPHRLDELATREWSDDAVAAAAAHEMFVQSETPLHAMVVMRQQSSWLRRSATEKEVARFSRKEHCGDW